MSLFLLYFNLRNLSYLIHKISSMYGVRIPLNKSYGGGEDEPCRAK